MPTCSPHGDTLGVITYRFMPPLGKESLPLGSKRPRKRGSIENKSSHARAPDDPGNAAQIHRFRSKTQQILDSVASVQDLGSVATRIAEVAEAVFPLRKQEIVKYSNPILLSMGITNMWRQWIAVKRTSKGKSLRDMLNRWKVWAAYLRQYRARKQQCRERKKQYLQDKMREAELASSNHDLRTVRSLAPKAPRARTQLKGKDGGMLSRAEEAEVFCEHFKQKFTSANAWRYDAAALYLNNIERSQNSQQLIDCESSIAKGGPPTGTPSERDLEAVRRSRRSDRHHCRQRSLVDIR